MGCDQRHDRADELYFVARNVRNVRGSGAAIFDPRADDAPAAPLRVGLVKEGTRANVFALWLMNAFANSLLGTLHARARG